MKLALVDYLGSKVSRLLSRNPFSQWPVTRSVDDDLPDVEVRYEFKGRGVELICDADERIKAIFLHPHVDESILEIPFTLTRQEVIGRFGPPSTSGDPMRDEILGEYGPWDLFSSEIGGIHIQYRVDVDAIHLITLMRRDAIPGGEVS